MSRVVLSAGTLLGEGALSRVWLLDESKNSGQVALKATSKGLLVLLQVADASIREARALRSASSSRQNPFIAQFLFACQDASHVYLGTEAVLSNDDGRSLSLRILLISQPSCQLGIEAACALICCLANAVVHLHELNVAHRDLKPENVCMRSDGSPVLVDFGGARVFEPHDRERSTSLLGTLAYLAPEMLSRQGHGFAVDWWALGVVAFEAIVGKVPFGDAACHAELVEAQQDVQARGVRLASAAQVLRRQDVDGSGTAQPHMLLDEALTGCLMFDECARANVMETWEARDSTKRWQSQLVGLHSALVVALHAVEVDSGDAADERATEEDPESAQWARAERDDLHERAEALWQRSSGKWQALFDTVYEPQWVVATLGREQQ
jgi:serine/threonine protein kinase